LVDTIVAIALGAFKMTSPDGYGFQGSGSGPKRESAL